MKKSYHDTIHVIERLHRRFLDVLSIELQRHGIEDINNVQALILYNIGPDTLTVGELTARGYYLGSNVSYNLKKMVENGFIDQERSQHDRRSVRIRLSPKGLSLRDKLANMFARHVDGLEKAGVSEDEVTRINDTLQKFENFWTAQLGYTPGMITG